LLLLLIEGRNRKKEGLGVEVILAGHIIRVRDYRKEWRRLSRWLGWWRQSLVTTYPQRRWLTPMRMIEWSCGVIALLHT
jgi:hypothetical protein